MINIEPSISKDQASISFKLNPTKIVKGLVALLLVSLILFTALSIFIGPSPDGVFSKLLDSQALKNIFSPNQTVAEKKGDKLLGGLLLEGLDERACQSRYQSHLYRTRQPRRHPSSYLVSRLRNYEALHKKCGPNTDEYNKTVEILKSAGGENISYSDCKYIIWTPFEGLGNRMLSLASTFLYALLTNRVLFIGEGESMPDLFCEPFPEVSWLLPSDFPISQFKNFNKFSPNSYGKLSRNSSINGNSKMMPPFAYIHMVFDFSRTEKLSFCDHDLTLLHDVPWLILKSNLYYVPSIFSIPSFQQELDHLFPEKETVFHHLGRYLFNPSNTVWGLITRYYDAYLSKADELLGIQVRIYHGGVNGFPNLDQILSCTRRENLLPEINTTETLIKNSEKGKTKAVLITSLLSNNYEEIRNIYWQHPTITGEKIALYQPSHEEQQKTGNEMHDSKALSEIFLLSMTDKLVTTARSTFGYVAQSLGGLRPWILYSDDRGRVPNPPCHQASSMEPCYQFAPEVYSCKNKNNTETASVLPHLRQCEDMTPGLKLFDNIENLSN